ncbi:MAG: hypothetical protein HYV08_12100 [Deltaproteobacteria bacterium]|nr:hypothetical protein [Deltaproteobacteria bacterium]MBI3075585.1 hypothetical protein [Deltaproteobacteria bacterium]
MSAPRPTRARFSPAGHQLRLVVEARALERQRKEAVAQLCVPPGTTFTITCDEGPYLDGEDTAPPPLAYLTASVAF